MEYLSKNHVIYKTPIFLRWKNEGLKGLYRLLRLGFKPLSSESPFLRVLYVGTYPLPVP